MIRYLKLTGLMMSAILCLFTSCETVGTGVDDSNVVTSVEVEILISSETLKWAEGSVNVTFSPSGQTKEIPVNEIYFAIEARPTTETDEILLNEFKSKKVMKATCTTTCDSKDTKITVKPALHVKPGTTTTGDATYDYEMTGSITYRKGLGASHWTHAYGHGFGIEGSGLDDFLIRHNISLIWADIL